MIMDEKAVKEEDIKLDEDYGLFLENIQNSDSYERIAIIIDELKNENNNIRLYCIKNIKDVSDVLGVKRTEEELIPLLFEIINGKEDNEEVLNSIAEVLPNISKNTNTLRALEILASNDSEVIRETVVEKIDEIIAESSQEYLNDEIFSLLERLAHNETKAKITSNMIIPVFYLHIEDTMSKNKLLEHMIKNCSDDAPLVRRSLAKSLSKFTNPKYYSLYNDKEKAMINEINQVMPIAVKLFSDSFDIVKAVSIESSILLYPYLSKNNKENLWEEIRKLCEKETSWRVKYVIADGLKVFCSDFSRDFIVKNVLNIVLQFLKDTEPEVKYSMLNNIEFIFGFLDYETIEGKLIPQLKDTISKETNYHVKSVFANKMFLIAKFVTEDFYESNIFPIVKKIVNEESFEVRVNSLNHIEELYKFFLPQVSLNNKDEFKSEIYNFFNNLSKDTKWRIRLIMSEKLKLLCSLLKPEVFIKEFWDLISNLYNDNVFQIREEALNTIITLCNRLQSFNIDFSLYQKDLVKLIENALSSNNYSKRICGIHTILNLLTKTDLVNDYQLLELQENSLDYNNLYCILTNKLFNCVNDKIANIRLTLSKSLKEIILFKPSLLNFRSNENDLTIENILKILERDEDSDVKYYTSEAMKELAK